MSAESNQLVLAERPQRGPVNDRTFRRETAQLPELKEGELRVRVDYVSIVSQIDHQAAVVERKRRVQTHISGPHSAELAQ